MANWNQFKLAVTYLKESFVAITTKKIICNENVSFNNLHLASVLNWNEFFLHTRTEVYISSCIIFKLLPLWSVLHLFYATKIIVIFKSDWIPCFIIFLVVHSFRDWANKFNSVNVHHVINVLFPQKINTLYIQQCNIVLYNLVCDLI